MNSKCCVQLLGFTSVPDPLLNPLFSNSIVWRFFYLTRPLLLGEAPPLPRLPLLRSGLQPVNRLFCTRKQALAHKGLLVVIDATELRLFYATELRVFDAWCASVLRTMCECLCAEGAGAQVSDDWLLMKKMGKSLVVWEIMIIFAAWIINL